MNGIQAWFGEVCEAFSRVFEAFEKVCEKILELFEINQAKKADASRKPAEVRGERLIGKHLIGIFAGAVPFWAALGGRVE